MLPVERDIKKIYASENFAEFYGLPTKQYADLYITDYGIIYSM